MANTFTVTQATGSGGILPLFVVDMTTLKKKLRLSGAVQPDTLAIIEECVQRVRVGFYDTLGVTVVNELLAIAYAANGTTEDQIRRAKANSIEVKWVRMCLLRELPMVFMDSSAAVQEAWNQEGLQRHMSREDILAEIEALMQEILTDLGEISGDEAEGASIRVMNIEPDVAPKRLLEVVLLRTLGD